MALLFKINKKKWEQFIALKGWRTPITTLAQRTGFGKSYCSQVINGGLTVSHDFMAKYIEVVGASHTNIEEWAPLFEIVKDAERSKTVKEPFRKPFKVAFDKDAYKKFRGEVPYDPHSPIGESRRLDAARNGDRLRLPNPVPAHQYYGDKDNYWQFRNGAGRRAG